MEITQDTYATKDLHLAAFFQTKGMRIEKLEHHSSAGKGWNPVYFIFSDRDTCDYLEGVFWSGEGDDAIINIKKYLTDVRSLRARASSVSKLSEKRKTSYDRNEQFR